MDITEEKHRSIIKGLQVFADANIFGVDVSHDTIHAGPSDPDLSADQEEVLKSLGWFKDQEHDCWSIFT